MTVGTILILMGASQVLQESMWLDTRRAQTRAGILLNEMTKMKT